MPTAYTDDPAAAATDTGRFCLDCHDGSWDGAANIAAELASETAIHSGFTKEDENLHRKHRNWPNPRAGETACSYCHDAHSNTGTSGINRGALLPSWMTVHEYPYTGKESCSTGDAEGACH